MTKITGAMPKEEKCKRKHGFTIEEGRLVLGLLKLSCSEQAAL
jgi:hypothetical protein